MSLQEIKERIVDQIVKKNNEVLERYVAKEVEEGIKERYCLLRASFGVLDMLKSKRPKDIRPDILATHDATGKELSPAAFSKEACKKIEKVTKEQQQYDEKTEALQSLIEAALGSGDYKIWEKLKKSVDKKQNNDKKS